MKGKHPPRFSYSLLKTRKGDDGRLLIPTDRLVKYIVDQTLLGATSEELAYSFHSILAKQICEAVRKISEETGVKTCALTGGVFQNSLLLRLCDDELSASGIKVYRHSLTPPNDGGLGLGQAAYGMYLLNHPVEAK